jgi:hypothetical protein
MRSFIYLGLALVFGMLTFCMNMTQAVAAPLPTVQSLIDLVQPAPAFKVSRHYDEYGYCYGRHLRCRYNHGFGWRYRDCMSYAGCGYSRPAHDEDDILRDCRHWHRECHNNWIYPEDIRGCLRFHGCAY